MYEHRILAAQSAATASSSTTNCPAPPAPGTKLLADGKDAAEISSAAYSPAFGEVVGLAYVRAEAVHDKPAMTVSGSEPAAEAYIPDSAAARTGN